MTSSSIQKMLLAAAALGAASVEAVSLSARAFLESKLAAQAGDAQCQSYNVFDCANVEVYPPPEGYEWGDKISDSTLENGPKTCFFWGVWYNKGEKSHWYYKVDFEKGKKECAYFPNWKWDGTKTYGWYNLETKCTFDWTQTLKIEADRWNSSKTAKDL